MCTAHRLPRITLFIVFCALTFFCLLAYSNSLHSPFIWDDDALVGKNALIRDWRLWPKAFTADLYLGATSGSNFYRPVQTLSLMWDYYFWQNNPFGYHLSNILLHGAVSFLVFLFVYRFHFGMAVAFLSSCLFALCPLATEAVTYISGRADVLMAFGLLMSLLFFQNWLMSRAGKRMFWYLSSLIFFMWGLFSKELAAAFPLVILAFVFYFHRQRLKEKGFFLQAILPFFALSAAYLLLRFTLFRFATIRPPELAQFPFLVRMAVFPRVLFTYFRLLLLPQDLHMSRSLGVPSTTAGIILLFVSLGALVYSCVRICIRLHKRAVFCFMLVWFFIFLIPQSGIFAINAFVAEHFIYLSSTSFFISVSFLLRRYCGRGFFTLCAVLLAGYYGLCTYAQNFKWQDPIAFYENILRLNPLSFQAHNNLGLQYEYRHEFKQAIEEYKKALSIRPNLLEGHSNLANIYFRMGLIPQARREYAIVEKTAPGAKAGEIQNNIGCVLELEGKLDEALERYRSALRLGPGLSFTHFNIARIHFVKKDLLSAGNEIQLSLPELVADTNARDAYSEIIAAHLASSTHLNAAHLFYNDLGVRFAQGGFLKAAQACFLKALELEPRFTDARFNLGLAYWEKGLKRKAIFEFKSALKIDPTYERARKLLFEITSKY
jgi:protein O-mannosyl-transferase